MVDGTREKVESMEDCEGGGVRGCRGKDPIHYRAPCEQCVWEGGKKPLEFSM